MKKKYLIFLILVVFTIVSCQKKELSTPFVEGSNNNPNALVITVMDSIHLFFYLNFANSAGHYDTTLHQSLIVTNGDTDSLHIQLLVRFNGEGTFIFNDTIPKLYNATDSIIITNKSTLKSTYYSPVFAKNYLDITTYDNVGGHINGLISGAFVNSFNRLDTLKISNGRFSVPRYPDVY